MQECECANIRYYFLFNKDFYVNECFPYMYESASCAIQCPLRPEKVIGFSGTRIMVSYKAPCRCWEQNLGLLKEQQVLLTTVNHSLAPKILLPIILKIYPEVTLLGYNGCHHVITLALTVKRVVVINNYCYSKKFNL